MKVVRKPSGVAPQPDDGCRADVPSLADIKALRHSQKETNRRVEELKLRLFRITDHHMDQAINIIKRWLDKNP